MLFWWTLPLVSFHFIFNLRNQLCVGFVVVLETLWIDSEEVIPSTEPEATIEWLRGDKSWFFLMGSEICPKGWDFIGWKVCENVMWSLLVLLMLGRCVTEAIDSPVREGGELRRRRRIIRSVCVRERELRGSTERHTV